MGVAAEAVVTLALWVEFQARGLLVVTVEALGLPVFVHGDAAEFSHLDDVESVFQFFNIVYEIMSFCPFWAVTSPFCFYPSLFLL